jgi:DNA-binding XRE family transcriptional regulator
MAKRGSGTTGKPTTARVPAASPAPSPPAKQRSPAAVSEPAARTATATPLDDEDLEDLQVVFGENLKIARQKADLSQAQLAEQTGLTQQYLSLIETGRKNVTLRTMIALATVVGQEVSVMLRRPLGRARRYLKNK